MFRMKVNSGYAKELPRKKKKDLPAPIPINQGLDLQGLRHSPLSYLAHIWIFIPAFVFFKVLNDNAVNVPILDDYDAILNFLHDFKAASFINKLVLLFSQHNEHRILHSRLLYISYYSLFGDINFRNIIFLGNLQLLPIFLVSIYFIRKTVDRYWSILSFIWALCIFDLNTYGNAITSMTAVQNYGVVMFFFITLFLYSLDRKYIIPAAVFQFVGIFSSGNGILASLVVAIYTLFGNDKVKKITSVSITVVFSLLYFLHYVPPSSATPADPNGFNVGTAVRFIIKMIGDPLDFDSAFLWGIVILIVLAAVFPYKNIRLNSKILPQVFIAGFCMATILASGYFRSNLKGVVPQTSRYLIYPQLLLASIASFIFLKVKGKKIQLPAIIVLSVIMLKVYRGNYEFGKSGFEREAFKAQTRHYYYPDTVRAKRIAQEASAAGIYSLEEER